MARPLSSTPLVHHYAFYDIHHSIPITRAQRDDLAAQVTHLHATQFTTSSLFVNIQFTHTPSPRLLSTSMGNPQPSSPLPPSLYHPGANFYSWPLALQFESPYWPCLPSLDAAKPHLRASPRAPRTPKPAREVASGGDIQRALRGHRQDLGRGRARAQQQPVRRARRRRHRYRHRFSCGCVRLRARAAQPRGAAYHLRASGRRRGVGEGVRATKGQGDRMWMQQHITEFERQAEEGVRMGS